MREFYLNHSMNWVDDNNRMVGYEYETKCCEVCGYELTTKEGREINQTELEPWSFTGLVIEDMEGSEAKMEGSDPQDGEREVFFEISHTSGELGYLRLYNIHNGYYYHGFVFSHNDEIIEDGYI